MSQLWTVWGRRIAARREALGLSCSDLAFLAQTHTSQLSRIEAGERGVSDALKPRLAQALNTTTEDLFPFSIHQPQPER